MAVDSVHDAHGSTAPTEPLDMFPFYRNGVGRCNTTRQSRLFSLDCSVLTIQPNGRSVQVGRIGHRVFDGRRRLHWPVRQRRTSGTQWVPVLNRRDDQ